MDAPLDRSAGGLGVGLTLARSLVSMHGGNIRAFSEGEGKGSRFTVKLPLVAAPTSDETSKPVRVRPRAVKGTKIVVVEDNEDSRELLCALLRRNGFDCHTADSGTTALSLTERVVPDIAILDVGLPEMDGFEVARRIRKNPKSEHILLIALTGYGRASDRLASHESGFDEHLVKPVRAEQLLRVLSEVQEEGRQRTN